jgi:hypothetical protein
MARYVLPTFNLDVGVWRHGTAPPAVPAVRLSGNLSPGEITGAGALESVPMMPGYQVPMFLRVAAGSYIGDGKAAGGADNVEIPFGSGRTYDVVFVDDIACGFANEHRLAVLLGKSPWPTPFPGGGSPPPPPPPAYSWPWHQTITTAGVPNIGLVSTPQTTVALTDQVVMTLVVIAAIPPFGVTWTRGAASGPMTLVGSFAVGGQTAWVYHGMSTVNSGLNSTVIGFPPFYQAQQILYDRCVRGTMPVVPFGTGVNSGGGLPITIPIGGLPGTSPYVLTGAAINVTIAGSGNLTWAGSGVADNASELVAGVLFQLDGMTLVSVNPSPITLTDSAASSLGWLGRGDNFR